jgi:hypothetical protein
MAGNAIEDDEDNGSALEPEEHFDYCMGAGVHRMSGDGFVR